MYTRLMTKDDIPAWLALAHEGDRNISELIPDISVFYKGFNEYMNAKVKQNEALMALDGYPEICLGIASFSRKNNRISFLGVAKEADFYSAGSKLLEAVLSKLNTKREITVKVIKSGDEIIERERQLYTDYGFIADEAEVVEAGIPASLMRRPAGKI